MTVWHADKPVNATRLPVTAAGGQRVYGAYFEGGMGYRIDRSKDDYRQNMDEIQRELARVTAEFSKATKERDELVKLKVPKSTDTCA